MTDLPRSLIARLIIVVVSTTLAAACSEAPRQVTGGIVPTRPKAAAHDEAFQVKPAGPVCSLPLLLQRPDLDGLDKEAGGGLGPWKLQLRSGSIAKDVSASHAGRGGIRVLIADGGEANLFQDVDAAPYRGQVLDIDAWIKQTGGDKGRLRVFVASIGGDSHDVLELRSSPSDPTPDPSWHRIKTSLLVDPNARTLRVGFHGYGPGEFLAVAIHGCAVAPQDTVELKGNIRRSGAPQGGAVIAAIQDGVIVSTATSTDDGLFKLTLGPGYYWLSAWHPSMGAAFGNRIHVGGDGDVEGETSLDLRYQEDSLTLDGRVSLGANSAHHLNALVTRVSEDSGDSFAVPIDDTGHIVARLPRADAYRALVASGNDFIEGRWKVTNDHDISFSSVRFSPPDTDTREVLKRHGLSLNAADLRHFPLRSVGLDSAVEIVGLGEASHGSAEIVRARCELTLSMADTLNLRAVGIEDSIQAARLVDDYIRNGIGDARAALKGLFQIYQTEEMEACLRSLRTWNEAHPKDMIRFFGLDIQDVEHSYASLVKSLSEVDGADVTGMWSPLLTFEHDDTSYAKDPRRVDELNKVFEDIEQKLKKHRGAWEHAIGKQRYSLIAEDLFALERIHQHNIATARGDSVGASTVRDRAMMERAVAVAKAMPRGSRVALWAHSVHLRKGHSDEYPTSLGEQLTRVLGERYFAVALMMGDAGFQSFEGRLGKRPMGLRGFEFGPPPRWTMDSALYELTGDIVALSTRRNTDLTNLPWMQSPSMMRVASAMIGDWSGMFIKIVPKIDFDLYLLTRKTTRATPIRTEPEYP